MKRRFDQAVKVTLKMVMESVLANNHRDKAGRVFKNRDWQFVTGFNRGARERAKAQSRHNPEAYAQVRQRWEALEFLFECHRAASFLFFKGNTFGEIVRRIVDAVFEEFPCAPPVANPRVRRLAGCSAGGFDACPNGLQI
jgi:hypothetical protein